MIRVQDCLQQMKNACLQVNLGVNKLKLKKSKLAILHFIHNFFLLSLLSFPTFKRNAHCEKNRK